MTTYVVTTANWNDPSFWASVGPADPGHTLDFSGLPSTFTVSTNAASGIVTISDGTTTFTIGEPGVGGTDANFGDTALLDYFTTLIGSDGDDSLEGTSTADTITGGLGDDILTGHSGDDSLRGGDGNDSLLGGTGNDFLTGEDGDDTVDGGAGNDSIDLGAGDGTTDTLVMSDGGGADTVSGFEGPIDNGDGTFTGQDQLDLSGLTDAGGIPVNTRDITVGDDGFGNALLTFPNGESITLVGIAPADVSDEDALAAMGVSVADDIVEGTAGDDNIDAAYAGDPEGDAIDAGDNAAGNDDDVITAGGGNDSVLAGLGNDSVDGGTGNDTLIGDEGNDSLSGGDGSDVISGDGEGVTASREFLDWSTLGPDETDLSAGFTQNTGNMDVVVSFTDTGNNSGTLSVESSDPIYTEAGEPFNPNASGDIRGSGDAATGTATLDFTPAQAGIGDEVENVAFRIADLDWAFDNHRDSVTVNAYDTDGNPVAVTLTPAGADTLSGNTVTAADTNEAPSSAEGSVLVEIAGPVSRIDIIYENAEFSGGHNIQISDVYFDTVTEPISGDDMLEGGAGNDTIDGGAGNDTIDGGEGADNIIAGDGDDDITVDQGDTVLGGDGEDVFRLEDLDTSGTGNAAIDITGGEGGETNGDTLILTPDVTFANINFTNTDDAAGGLSGNFTMADGTVVTFSEMENIICFTPGTMILTSHGDRPIETLEVGDMVVTRDQGLRPIRWIGTRTVRGHGAFAPIRVGANALDPTRNGLLVSPQHRILYTGYRAELLFGDPEVLVPAKHLVDGLEVTVEPRDEITYIHLMFDHHEVIYAEGIATESFHAGDMGLSAIHDAAREELFAIFPELRSAPGQHLETVRPCLKKHEAALLIEAANDAYA